MTKVSPESGSEVMFSLKDMSPDLDGDGTVGQFEKEIFDMLSAADVDGDGQISNAEFWHFLRQLRQMRKDNSSKLTAARTESAEFKRYLKVAGLTILLLIVALTGMVILVTVLFKDQYTTAGSGHVTNKAGEVVRSGGLGIDAEALDSRRRRLVTIGHRQLVSVGEVDKTECQAKFADAKNGRETCGVAFTTDDKKQTAHKGCATQWDEGDDSVTIQASGVGEVTLDKCSTLLVAARRLRQLSITEASEPSRHRRLAARMNDKYKSVHEGCVIYHCFEGEYKCDDPSPASACAEWEQDGITCAVPLCKLVAAEDPDEL
jgi:hypothetical protein